MKIKTSELSGAALDFAVAKCEGFKPSDLYIVRGSVFARQKDEDGNYTGSYVTGPDRLYSRKWEAGGPIIEREKIELSWSKLWKVWTSLDKRNGMLSFIGDTPLIAAMRCYVASKLGDKVEVPDELI